MYLERPRWPDGAHAEITALDLSEGAAVHVRSAGTDWLFDSGGETGFQARLARLPPIARRQSPRRSGADARRCRAYRRRHAESCGLSGHGNWSILLRLTVRSSIAASSRNARNNPYPESSSLPGPISPLSTRHRPHSFPPPDFRARRWRTIRRWWCSFSCLAIRAFFSCRIAARRQSAPCSNGSRTCEATCSSKASITLARPARPNFSTPSSRKQSSLPRANPRRINASKKIGRRW